MEIARVLGSMVKSGWRPRRTIVFASWAVEEFGLEGSYEYVFENINKIMNRYEYLERYTFTLGARTVWVWLNWVQLN